MESGVILIIAIVGALVAFGAYLALKAFLGRK